jgi:hypothetical protein
MESQPETGGTLLPSLFLTITIIRSVGICIECMSLGSHQPEKLPVCRAGLKKDSLSGFLCDKLQVKVLPDGTMKYK